MLCLAFKAKMTAKDDYVWFLRDKVAKSWLYRKSQKNLTATLPCPESNIDEMLEGHFALSQQFYSPDDSYNLGNTTLSVKQWKEDMSNGSLTTDLFASPSYLGFVYDSVLLYAFALQDRIRYDSQFPLNFKLNQTNIKSLARSIDKTEFQGVSGRFRLNEKGSRITNKTVMQWVNGNWSKVFSLNSNTMELIAGNEIYWSNGAVPSDGSPNLLLTSLLWVIYGVLIIVGVALVTFLYSMQRYKSQLARAYEVSFIVSFHNKSSFSKMVFHCFCNFRY